MVEGWVTSIVIGIIMMGAGVVILQNKEFSSLSSLGWIFLLGGIVIIGLSIYSKVRKP